jgi:hypothetical protein
MDSFAELSLREAPESVVGPIRDDGRIPIVIIRPGIGRGRGRRLYEADMLKREVAAGRFRGWRMYYDHQSPEAKRRAGGLPRSVRDLGGMISEVWWDPTYRHPDDARTGHKQGAVMGLAKPARLARMLAEDIPEALGTSISGHATKLRPAVVNGEQVSLVEGIAERGSVDWVTEPGAGGRVVTVMEALEEAWDDKEEATELLEALTDDELLEVVKKERPDLYEGLLTEAQNGAAVEEQNDEEGDEDDELQRLIQKYLKKGLNRKMAVRAAQRELKTVSEAADLEGGETVSETLEEALRSDEGQNLIDEIVRQRVDSLVAPRMAEIVEARIEEERELIQAEVAAASQRRTQLRDMRDAAHTQIREAKLPDTFKEVLFGKYDVREDKATPELDAIADERDEEGKVVKKAEEKLTEVVSSEIETQRALVASVSPTRVHGQGPAKAVVEESETGKADTDGRKSTGSPLTDQLLLEAGFPADDLDSFFDK